jgi:hypothetical protein
MEKLSREREKEVLDFKDQQVNDFINVKWNKMKWWRNSQTIWSNLKRKKDDLKRGASEAEKNWKKSKAFRWIERTER